MSTHSSLPSSSFTSDEENPSECKTTSKSCQFDEINSPKIGKSTLYLESDETDSSLSELNDLCLSLSGESTMPLCIGTLDSLHRLDLSFVTNSSMDDLPVHSDYVEDFSLNEWIENSGLFHETFSNMISSCLREGIIIAHESKVIDAKTKAIFNFDRKDLSSQIIKNEPEINQSHEIVGIVSKKCPQFDESCASSKDYSMRNTRN